MRELTPDQKVVLERFIADFCDNPDISEADLIPHMKSICEGTELTLKTFCPLAHNLLIDRDQGPKLTTLLTTVGGKRALPLFEASFIAAT